MSDPSMPIIHSAFLRLLPTSYRPPAYHLSRAMQAINWEQFFEEIKKSEEAARYITLTTLIHKTLSVPLIKTLPPFSYLLKKNDKAHFFVEQDYFEEMLEIFKNQSPDSIPSTPNGLSLETRRRAYVYYTHSPSVAIYHATIPTTKELFSKKEKITLLNESESLFPSSSITHFIQNDTEEEKNRFISLVEQKYPKKWKKLKEIENRKKEESGLMHDANQELNTKEKINLIASLPSLQRKSYRKFLKIK